MDYQGLALDYEGAGSILGAEGVGNLPSVGGMPALGQAPSVGVGQAASLGTLSVPQSWTNAVSPVTPLPVLDANAMPGGWGAAPAGAVTASRTGVSQLPLGGMVGRESDGAVHRIGLRPSLIPRSPVAG
jgi:hypothetical protein